MTNLSNELCEICGIEPKWIKYETETTDGCINLGSKKVYPDFEQPENFVKLLEIVSKKSGVSLCHNGTYFGCSIHYFIADIFEADIGTIPHNFLNTLLKQHLRNPCKPKLLEQLKETIRAEEWKYE